MTKTEDKKKRQKKDKRARKKGRNEERKDGRDVGTLIPETLFTCDV